MQEEGVGLILQQESGLLLSLLVLLVVLLLCVQGWVLGKFVLRLQTELVLDWEGTNYRARVGVTFGMVGAWRFPNLSSLSLIPYFSGSHWCLLRQDSLGTSKHGAKRSCWGGPSKGSSMLRLFWSLRFDVLWIFHRDFEDGRYLYPLVVDCCPSPAGEVEAFLSGWKWLLEGGRKLSSGDQSCE